MALPKLESPSYTMTIPSTGKAVEYRPFNVKEQKTLLLAKESDDEQAMVRATRDLITSCVVTPIDVNKLTLFDFEFMFLQVRAKSVGETSDIQIKCHDCGEFNPITINLEEAKVLGEVQKDNKIELTDTIGLLMSYPMFESSMRLISQRKSDTEAAFSTLIDCIDAIYDESAVYTAEDTPRKELVEFIDQLSNKQFEAVTDFINSSPVIGLEVNFNCTKCEVLNEETITGLKNFF